MSVADAPVREWPADGDLAVASVVAGSAGGRAASGYVDLDALETVHVSSVAPTGR